MKLRRPSKKITIISLLSALIIVAAGVYTWQSLAAWQGYESRLLAEKAEYERLKESAISGDSAKTRLTAIRSLDDKLRQRSSLCYMNPFFAWQAVVIPPLKEGVKQCEAEVKQLNLVAMPLSALRQYLDAAEKLQAIVITLAPTEAFTDKNWAEKGVAQAKKVQSDLKKLEVASDTDAGQLKSKALGYADSLVAAWEQLMQANEAKDKTGFITGSAAVVKAYADFTGLADAADTVIKQKVSELMKVAAKL
ncbi:MAG: hypothetical protein V4678_02705 [Patescibacteria group bacterium]